MALPVSSLELVHGKVVEWRNGMAKNGNPEPSFYTDGERTLFLVTLPCRSDWVITDSVTKSSEKVTKSSGEVTKLFIKLIAIVDFIKKGKNY